MGAPPGSVKTHLNPGGVAQLVRLSPYAEGAVPQDTYKKQSVNA